MVAETGGGSEASPSPGQAGRRTPAAGGGPLVLHVQLAQLALALQQAGELVDVDDLGLVVVGVRQRLVGQVEERRRVGLLAVRGSVARAGGPHPATRWVYSPSCSRDSRWTGCGRRSGSARRSRRVPSLRKAVLAPATAPARGFRHWSTRRYGPKGPQVPQVHTAAGDGPVRHHGSFLSCMRGCLKAALTRSSEHP